MARTRTNIRQAVAKEFGLRHFISQTSTAGGTTTATDVDALGQFVDDGLVGYHYYNAAVAWTDHVITDNVQSTGVVTFIPGHGSITGAQAYEILPFSATAIHRAIDEAFLMLFNEGILVRKVITRGGSGVPVYNGGFDYWSSFTTPTVDGWTAATATLTRQTSGNETNWVSDHAARLSSSQGTLTLDARKARYLADSAGSTIRLHAWVKAVAGSDARIHILENGSVVASSGYHSGDSDWHLLSTDDYKITDAETDISVQLQGGGSNAFFNFVWIEGGHSPDLYPLPIGLYPNGPTEIYISPMGTDVDNQTANVVPHSMKPLTGWDWFHYHDELVGQENGVIRWIRKPPSGYMLTFFGNTSISLPDDNTDNVEINQSEEILVSKVAALILMENNPRSGDKLWADRAGRLSRDIQRLSKGYANSDDAASLGPNW